MHSKILTAVALLGLVAFSPVCAQSQPAFKQLPITNEAWVKPFPPLRIVGNLYYVGTYDLAVYLITTNAGSILINTGVNNSVPA